MGKEKICRVCGATRFDLQARLRLGLAANFAGSVTHDFVLPLGVVALATKESVWAMLFSLQHWNTVRNDITVLITYD